MVIILFTLVITLILWALAMWILWGGVRIVRKCLRKGRVAYRPFGYVTLAVGVLWTLLLFYGYFWGRWRYEVVEWHCTDNRIPTSFEGYKIVHISDFHIEGFEDNPSFVDTLVNVINQQQPDLICFTGDLVSISHKGLLPFMLQLKRLQARDGVVSILGNHDYAVYDRRLDSLTREQDRAQLIALERDELHWRLLLNEHFVLHHATDSIYIIGSENQACGPHQKVRRGNLAAALQGTEDGFKLLLSHDPSHWDAEVVGKTDVALTLSGHTHAMQFRVGGWTPCRWFYERSDGSYRQGNQQIYVNIGLGELMPFRIGATPEITVIKLHSAQ